MKEGKHSVRQCHVLLSVKVNCGLHWKLDTAAIVLKSIHYLYLFCLWHRQIDLREWAMSLGTYMTNFEWNIFANRKWLMECNFWKLIRLNGFFIMKFVGGKAARKFSTMQRVKLIFQFFICCTTENALTSWFIGSVYGSGHSSCGKIYYTISSLHLYIWAEVVDGSCSSYIIILQLAYLPAVHNLASFSGFHNLQCLVAFSMQI